MALWEGSRTAQALYPQLLLGLYCCNGLHLVLSKLWHFHKNFWFWGIGNYDFFFLDVLNSVTIFHTFYSKTLAEEERILKSCPELQRYQ